MWEWIIYAHGDRTVSEQGRTGSLGARGTAIVLVAARIRYRPGTLAGGQLNYLSPSSPHSLIAMPLMALAAVALVDSRAESRSSGRARFSRCSRWRRTCSSVDNVYGILPSVFRQVARADIRMSSSVDPGVALVAIAAPFLARLVGSKSAQAHARPAPRPRLRLAGPPLHTALQLRPGVVHARAGGALGSHLYDDATPLG